MPSKLQERETDTRPRCIVRNLRASELDRPQASRIREKTASTHDGTRVTAVGLFEDNNY